MTKIKSISLEEIKRRLPGHRNWLHQIGDYESPMDLSNTNLSGFDLSPYLLTNAKFTNANMVNVIWPKINLMDADLTNVKTSPEIKIYVIEMSITTWTFVWDGKKLHGGRVPPTPSMNWILTPPKVFDQLQFILEEE